MNHMLTIFQYADMGKDSPMSINYGSNQLELIVNKALPQPLLIDPPAAQDISITVKANAQVHVFAVDLENINLQVQKEAQACLYILNKTFTSPLKSIVKAELSDKAKLDIFEIALADSQLERSSTIELMGDNAHFAYFGLDQLHGTSIKKSLLEISHKAKNTQSLQSFRGIYGGECSGVFLGKVIIDKTASQSLAKQRYKSIILNSGAKAFVMPQLEINNQDVVAAHGASIGELDDDALFYLCSRGLSLIDAKSMLINSLAQDILSNIEIATVKEAVTTSIAESIKHTFGGMS